MANNTDWLTQDLSSPMGVAGAATGNPWLTAIGALGQAGQGMLRGTNQEWMAAPGAVAAGMAQNMQAADANKSQLATLQTLAKVLQDPLMKGGKINMKPDGTIGFDLQSTPNAEIQQPTGPAPRANMVPPQMQPTLASSVNQQGASALGSSPFLSALLSKPWQQSTAQ
jgi:hypothetical protein